MKRVIAAAGLAAVIALVVVGLSRWVAAGDDGATQLREVSSAAPATTTSTVKPVGEVATARYGPFTVPAKSNGGEDHVNIVRGDLAPPCTDCYITEFTPDLVYEEGHSANLDSGLMLHHAVFTDPSKIDVTCGQRGYLRAAGQRFYGAGNERTVGALPKGFGYGVGSGPWIGLFEIMNHTEIERTVFFTLTVRWRPASDPDVKPATPVWLDVENCRSSEFDVPAGAYERRASWTSTITGRVIAAAGHVHDGGVATELTNATTGQRLCRSVAGYGTKRAYLNTVESMSVCTLDRLGTVRAGETLDLVTTYNASKPVPDAMGIMLAFVHETDDLDGGTAPSPAATEPKPAQTPPPVHLH